MLLVVFCSGGALTPAGWAQAIEQSPVRPNAAPALQEQQNPVSGRMEDSVERIGPLEIQGQSFKVVLHLKHLRSSREETVAIMEISDGRGNAVYEETFPFAIEDDHFIETVGISARVLEGVQSSGILITYAREPSTPLGGTSYQVFGLSKGALVAFSKPISFEGTLDEPEPPPEIVTTSSDPELGAEVIRFRVWTGYFFVTVPIRVDWQQAKVTPAWLCMAIPSGVQSACRFHPEVQRLQSAEASTLVHLLPEAFKPDAQAQPVTVQKTAKIEFLEAAGVMQWNERADTISLDLSEDLWLKVRIDGQEGWIHTPEDFNAIGLPRAG